MDKEKAVKYIEGIIGGMFKTWPIKPKVTVSQKEDAVMVDISTGKASIFGPPNAGPLLALQHLVRLMVRKEFPDDFVHLSINIGSFHQRQREALMKVAKEAIARAIKSGEPVYLPPMSSFERRIVHLYVAAESGVASESAGGGPARRVVIKPEPSK